MNDENDDLRPEYDDEFLSKGGVRGRHFVPRSEARCVTHISVDMRQAFPTDEEVENALRLVANLRALVAPSTRTPAAEDQPNPADLRQTG